MKFEYFIGSRYLKSRQKTGFISFITVLSIAGVTVGVMALVIVIAVMTGAESYFKTKILGVEPHVVLHHHEGSIPEYASVIDRLEASGLTESVMPYAETQVMLRSGSGMSGAVLRGLNPEARGSHIIGLSRKELKEKLSPGQSRDSNTETPPLVLGKNLARSLGVNSGDVIYLISSRGMMTPAGHMPSMKRFLVKGVFESGFYEYDASLAYTHLEATQGLLRIGDAVTGIGIRVDDIYKADQIAEKIQKNLGFPYWTMDWMEMNRNFFSALKLEKTVMFIILTLIILVAAFNIASTLIMMVMSKTRDIAILKAMGATDRSIRKIFVFNGLVIGAIGTALGTALGLTGCFLLQHYQFVQLPGDVYYFTTLPVEVRWTDVAIIVSAALGICLGATLYPAGKASRLNPVEALRHG
ncbi:MAG: lipoprotein-releasing ABC transporter permease subunit [Desulfosalsimonas sp.]|uniref:lipoprotein-releasing ABC transporter permease subunit n=1 Tax=Desulfosalsimonas sp. TaxID=3073848 RepID=UPI0039706A38